MVVVCAYSHIVRTLLNEDNISMYCYSGLIGWIY